MILETIIISLLAVTVVLLLILIFKKPKTVSLLDDEIIKNSFASQADLFKSLNELILNYIKTNNDYVIKELNNQYLYAQNQFQTLLTKLETILQSNETKLNIATEKINVGLEKIQTSNEKKLDQMRQTVDEKLNITLERRLGESFNAINERLQAVYVGLGEMKTLASGVGDLKKVLTNVKTRGTWSEIQLENLLEQILTNKQYKTQVDIKGNGQRVDFAIVLPGKDNKNIYLPIDAKFPIEDYNRLVKASENGSAEEIEKILKQLEKRIKEEAKSIREKYVDVPNTTDFAIMYLAIEGLYAEVLRRAGLAESLQQKFKVVVCGPTTITALLNSLQLGFKTLAIEKRSSEIYGLLGIFKQEFGKFVDLLAKTQKKLAEVSNTIESATKKSQTIQKKLKDVVIITDEKTQINFDDIE